MINEPRLLVSDSIKDDIAEFPDSVNNESKIPILALFEVGSDEGVITILRGLDVSKEKLKFVFSCNCIDSLRFFSNFQTKIGCQFDAAIIEYQNQTDQFDLKPFKVDSFNIKEIDSEKQTSNCEVFLVRDHI